MVYHNRAKEREKQASPLEGLGEAQIEAWIERLRGESWLLSVSLPDAKERMPGAEPLGCSPSKIWDIALFSVAKKPGNNQKSPLGDKRINKMQYIHVVVQSLSHVWLFATSWTSMPDFPVLHYLPEFVQTRVHWVDDAIQPYHPSVIPFSSCPQSFPASESFPKSWLFASGGQSIGASASASVLPMNNQDWFSLGVTDLLSYCPRDSQESSPAPQFKTISSSVLSLLYGPTLTSSLNYWKNHSFDYMDLCWQSDVSAF